MADALIISDLLMPRLGETMEEGRIITWLKAVGEEFKRGEAILEIETDKTLAEFPALTDGRMVDVLAEPGTMQNVGAVIAKIEIKDKNKILPIKKAHNVQQNKLASIVSAKEASSKQTRATPIARRRAVIKGINIDDLYGTGPNFRVELHDVTKVSDIGTINYKVLGKKTGLPIVFIHGFGSEMSSWSEIASQLATLGACALILDLPGHGKTTSEAQSLSDLNIGIADLIQSVFPNKPVYLVAHSLGAQIALSLIKQHPLLGMMLIAPVGLGSYINVEFITALSNVSTHAELAHALRLLTKNINLITDKIVKHTFTQLSSKRLLALKNSFISSNKTQTIDLISKINAASNDLDLSVLIGHHDKIISWQDVFNLNPNVSIHHFNNSGHMPQWESSKAVVKLIQRKMKL